MWTPAITMSTQLHAVDTAIGDRDLIAAAPAA